MSNLYTSTLTKEEDAAVVAQMWADSNPDRGLRNLFLTTWHEASVGRGHEARDLRLLHMQSFPMHERFPNLEGSAMVLDFSMYDLKVQGSAEAHKSAARHRLPDKCPVFHTAALLTWQIDVQKHSIVKDIQLQQQASFERMDVQSNTLVNQAMPKWHGRYLVWARDPFKRIHDDTVITDLNTYCDNLGLVKCHSTKMHR